MENSTKSSLDNLFAIIRTGRAVLFTGAGFSCGCTNLLGKEPPLAKELSHMICNKGQFKEDDDLAYTADYFLNNKNKNDLLFMLKENFTLNHVEDYHCKITGLKWKRIYTTNYDNSIEEAAKKSNKVIYSLSIDDSPKEFYKKNNCCVHINGSIESASECDLCHRRC